MIESIGNILSKRASLSGVGRTIADSLVVEKFNEFLAEEFSSHKNKTQAVYIKNEIIYLIVLDSILAQEIKFKEHLLIDKTNKCLKQDIIQGIRFLG